MNYKIMRRVYLSGDEVEETDGADGAEASADGADVADADDVRMTFTVMPMLHEEPGGQDQHTLAGNGKRRSEKKIANLAGAGRPPSEVARRRGGTLGRRAGGGRKLGRKLCDVA